MAPSVTLLLPHLPRSEAEAAVSSALMAQPNRVIYQFPISHYCEKTRWHMDVKGLGYKLRNLLPGTHILVTRWRSGDRTVPVLVDNGRTIGDSTTIAHYLEENYPGASLLPKSGAERARVLEVESYFDDLLGPAVRKWVYGHALATPGTVEALFFRDYSAGGRLAGRFIAPVLEREIRRLYRIDAPGIEEASREIDVAIDRLEEMIDGDPTRYLVGNSLTLADVTAAALLAPLVAPPGSPWTNVERPEVLPPRRELLRARPAGQWVLARYANDRGSSALTQGSIGR
jgi:glutathione S-transferase